MTREEAIAQGCWWGVNEPERMNTRDPDEAIGNYLDDCSPLPETVFLQAYAPQKVGPDDCGWPLEHVLEKLDEEHADPDDDHGTAQTPSMLEAERIFKEAILAEYVSWSCEPVYSEDVNVSEWCERTGNMQLLEGPK